MARIMNRIKAPRSFSSSSVWDINSVPHETFIKVEKSPITFFQKKPYWLGKPTSACVCCPPFFLFPLYTTDLVAAWTAAVITTIRESDTLSLVIAT